MRRMAALASVLFLASGCGVLSKQSVVGNWNVGGTAFVIPGVEKASGTARFTETSVDYDIKLDLANNQGSVSLKMGGTYTINGDTFSQNIGNMKPDVTKLDPAVQELAKAQFESSEVKAMLNKVGAAKIKSTSAIQSVITFPDGKTIVLDKAS